MSPNCVPGRSSALGMHSDYFLRQERFMPSQLPTVQEWSQTTDRQLINTQRNPVGRPGQLNSIAGSGAFGLSLRPLSTKPPSS